MYVYGGEVWCILIFLKKSGNHYKDNLSHQSLANIDIPIVYIQCKSIEVVEKHKAVFK